MKRVSLELGGHAPFIIFDDADMPAAVQQVMASKFRNAGQTCVCANRIYVHERIHDAFAESVRRRGEGLRVGDPMSDADADRSARRSAGARQGRRARRRRGAEGRARDRRRPASATGCIFDPTVLVDVKRGMRILEEETFGPVAPIVGFTDEAEAIRAANATPYGLAAYIWTRDLGRAFRVAEALDYGIVGVNDGLPATPHAPFGGVKDSGIGREGGKWGLDEYLDVKYISIALP